MYAHAMALLYIRNNVNDLTTIMIIFQICHCHMVTANRLEDWVRTNCGLKLKGMKVCILNRAGLYFKVSIVTVHAKTSLVRTKIEINFLSPAYSYTH